MEKMNDQCGSVTVFLNDTPDERLLSDFKDKGFVIKYQLAYDQKRENPYNCRLRIVNPHCQDPGSTFLDNLEENLTNFGFNKANLDTEESVKKLFNGFFAM